MQKANILYFDKATKEPAFPALNPALCWPCARRTGQPEQVHIVTLIQSLFLTFCFAGILFHTVHVCCRAHVLFILCSHSIAGPVAVVLEDCWACGRRLAKLVRLCPSAKTVWLPTPHQSPESLRLDASRARCLCSLISLRLTPSRLVPVTPAIPRAFSSRWAPLLPTLPPTTLLCLPCSHAHPSPRLASTRHLPRAASRFARTRLEAAPHTAPPRDPVSIRLPYPPTVPA